MMLTKFVEAAVVGASAAAVSGWLAFSPPLVADVSFTTEGIATIAALLTALVTALVYVHKLLVGQLTEEKETWKNLYAEREAMDEALISKQRGTRRMSKLLPVVPEHNSPVTDKQRGVSELAQARAVTTEHREMLGMLPRTEAEKAGDTINFKEEFKEYYKEADVHMLKGPTEVNVHVTDEAPVELITPDGALPGDAKVTVEEGSTVKMIAPPGTTEIVQKPPGDPENVHE